MTANNELRPGWLIPDLERASKRVQELKIAKSNFTDPIEIDVPENQIQDDEKLEAEILQC